MEGVYSIDADAGLHAIAAACTVRLKSYGWTQQECEQSIDRASGKVCKKLDDVKDELIGNVAACISNGGSEKHCDTIALVQFAIVGVDIADELNRARIAERN